MSFLWDETNSIWFCFWFRWKSCPEQNNSFENLSTADYKPSTSYLRMSTILDDAFSDDWNNDKFTSKNKLIKFKYNIQNYGIP